MILMRFDAMHLHCSCEDIVFVYSSIGYPAPELKWYKDDMEMDRYCGLPKYEIHRNGKTHTLHIYKYVTPHIFICLFSLYAEF